ncbi:MAG: 2-oxoglutarate dehydrogenase, E2 component, dihydrolipoamide succinyltransferase [Nocardioidaceae bacterium]
MATSVTLPALGESVTEGTVTRWLKQPGDRVEVDEPLLEVSTDKVDTEIPSPVAGTLLEIKVQEDETVEVGAELCTVGDEGESGGESEAGDESTSEQESAEAEAEGGEGEAGAGEGAGGETGEAAAPAEADRQTEPQGEVPEARTEDTGPAQETAPGSADSKPEMEASREGTKAGGAGTPVTLPALGESVTEGTVTRWLKQVGDDVAVDEPLLEVSTDKVDTEIPSPVAGKLLEIKVEEDETVEVGAELAVIGSGQPAPEEEAPKTPEPPSEPTAAEETTAKVEQKAEETGESAQAVARDQAAAEEQGKMAEPEKAPAEEAEAPKAEAPKHEAEPAPSKEAVEGAYVTPLVRKMAADQGVDLSQVKGTGVGGRIRKQDVLEAAKTQKAQAEKQPEPAAAPAAAAPQAAPTAAPSPLRGKTEPLSRLRKVIAKRMVESLQTSAQLTTVVEVDVTSIARLRDSVKAEFAEREGVKLSFMPFLAKAAIDALKAHPSLNAAIDTEKGEVTYYDHENLSVAVDTEKGLLTPVIKDAGDLSVAGLARKIADIADRTRNNKIGPDELAGGTFTLTNTGSRGALFDTPIINQPQVAILGTGAIVKRPVVIDDPNLGETIAVRHMMYLALTYDHRLVDGADAARFLTDVKQRLEAGQFEV